MFKKRKLNKICFSLTLALAVLVSAFVLVRVNAADDQTNSIFKDCNLYSWEVSDINNVPSIITYYQKYYYNSEDWNNHTTATEFTDYVAVNTMNNYFHVQQIPYYYTLLIPNYPFIDGFTINYNNSNSVSYIFVLYNDYSFDMIPVQGSVSYFPLADMSIIALGLLNYTETHYASNIVSMDNDKLNSDLYYQGYSQGYIDGVNSGENYSNELYENQLSLKDAQIADLNAQIELLRNDSIDLSFKSLLNEILKYPINMVKTVFYHNDQPIELFGVSLPGLILGIFGIALSIGIIAIVKRVWK